MKKSFTLTLCIAIVSTLATNTFAQTARDINIEPVKPPSYYFLTDSFNDANDTGRSSAFGGEKLDNKQKELMRRMGKIYETHLQAVRNQINDEPLQAERNITKALKAVQTLIEEYPEVQQEDRFTELYRTVYTEYRSFYGIEEIENEERGEIFAVKRALYEGENDWMKGGRYVLPENITTPDTEVPLVYNDKVNRHLAFYSRERPEVMAKWMRRSQKYFPMMRQIFREEGVPTELVYLAMIESGLNPVARSWASAVGMWQFIKTTGASYGLEVNWWMDERRDPEKATRAAARHLKDLYNIWGDWHLAIANYNISPRGLKRAIRAGGGKEDYWSAYPYLPRETQGYIPGFIATTIINRNAEAFGFKDDYDTQAYEYEVAEVAPLMPLEKLAEAAGISTEELKDYNPELLRWATPPGSKYPLKLPTGTKKQFVANYEQIPKDERSQGIAVHTVSRGETLGRIARKYGSSVRAIYETNEGLSSIIHPGQKIVVPLAPGSSRKIAAAKPTNNSSNKTSTRSRQRRTVPEGRTAVKYTVKAGDTIGHIAEWYDVHASQIRAWNGTSNTITVGEKLTVYVPDDKTDYYNRVNSFTFSKKQQIEREQRSGKDVTRIYATSVNDDGTVQYIVKQNDTLIDIAQSFGTSVANIKQSNNLNGSRIYAGQRLKINKVN